VSLTSIILFKKEEEGVEFYEWWWERGKRPSGIVIQYVPERKVYALMFIVRGSQVGEIREFKRVSEALDYLRVKHFIDARIHV